MNDYVQSWSSGDTDLFHESTLTTSHPLGVLQGSKKQIHRMLEQITLMLEKDTVMQIHVSRFYSVFVQPRCQEVGIHPQVASTFDLPSKARCVSCRYTPTVSSTLDLPFKEGVSIQGTYLSASGVHSTGPFCESSISWTSRVTPYFDNYLVRHVERETLLMCLVLNTVLSTRHIPGSQEYNSGPCVVAGLFFKHGGSDLGLLRMIWPPQAELECCRVCPRRAQSARTRGPCPRADCNYLNLPLCLTVKKGNQPFISLQPISRDLCTEGNS